MLKKSVMAAGVLAVCIGLTACGQGEEILPPADSPMERCQPLHGISGMMNRRMNRRSMRK